MNALTTSVCLSLEKISEIGEYNIMSSGSTYITYE